MLNMQFAKQISRKLWLAHRGFSVLELMVVVIILAVVSATAVPGFTQFIANTQIRTTSESIRNGLQLARAEAVKRNTQIRFSLGADASWQFGCVIVVAATCPAVIQSKSAREGGSNNIIINITGANNITFTSLGIATPAPGQLSIVNIDHSGIPADTSRNLRVAVNAGGSVKMCDPNLTTTTDPRRCV